MNWPVESRMDEGDCARMLQDSFEKINFRDVIKSDSYLTYYMHAQFYGSFNRLFGNFTT